MMEGLHLAELGVKMWFLTHTPPPQHEVALTPKCQPMRYTQDWTYAFMIDPIYRVSQT